MWPCGAAPTARGASVGVDEGRHATSPSPIYARNFHVTYICPCARGARRRRPSIQFHRERAVGVSASVSRLGVSLHRLSLRSVHTSATPKRFCRHVAELVVHEFVNRNRQV